MSYSFPYICFVVFLLALSAVQLSFRLEDRSQKVIGLVAIIGYIFFIGGRGLIGWDWVNYYNAFKDAVPIQRFLSYNDWTFSEPGFNLWMSIIKTYTSKYWIFVLVSTLLNAFLLHILFRRYLEPQYYAFALAVFMVVYGFTFSTDLMRNFTGLLIFLFALPFIEKRQWYFFFPAVFIGCLFHWSIAILTICYFFLHLRIPLKAWLIMFVVANIIFLAGLPSISLIIKGVAALFPQEQQELILEYVQNSIYGKQYGLSLGYLERTGVFLLVLFYYQKLIEEKTSNILFINAFLTFALICLICYEFNIFITRFGALFAFGSWIIYPKILNHLDKALRPIYWLVIAAIIIVKMSSIANNVLYRYENVFTSEQISTYEQRRQIFDDNQKRLMK
jgi:hypothetical protein